MTKKTLFIWVFLLIRFIPMPEISAGESSKPENRVQQSAEKKKPTRKPPRGNL
jgi:hypothetical protein